MTVNEFGREALLSIFGLSFVHIIPIFSARYPPFRLAHCRFGAVGSCKLKIQKDVIQVCMLRGGKNSNLYPDSSRRNIFHINFQGRVNGRMLVIINGTAAALTTRFFFSFLWNLGQSYRLKVNREFSKSRFVFETHLCRYDGRHGPSWAAY